jgi:hypothetical protein
MQADADIPLFDRHVTGATWLGSATLNLNVGYDELSGFARTPSTQVNVRWALSNSIALGYSRSYRKSAPSVSQLYTPVVFMPATLIYDDRNDAIAAVNLITGGNKRLVPSSTTTDFYRLSVHGQRRVVQIAADIGYSSSRTIDPIFSFSNPSALLEALRPSLFVRDGKGDLVQVDTRMFNAVASQMKGLSSEIHLAGSLPLPAAIRSPNVREASFGPSASWDLSANYEYTFRNRVIIASEAPPIDILKTPFNLPPGIPSRHRINILAALSAGNCGVSVGGSWRSGFSGAKSSLIGSMTGFSALMVINAEASVTLGRSSDENDARQFRVKLALGGVCI